MNFMDYRKSLGLGIDDEEKVRFFFTKIFNILDSINHDGSFRLSDKEYF